MTEETLNNTDPKTNSPSALKSTSASGHEGTPDKPDLEAATVAESSGLKRHLEARHLQMIAIGGFILVFLYNLKEQLAQGSSLVVAQQ